MIALELIEIDGEVGVVFPDEVLARLGVGPDETVYAVEGPSRSMILTRTKPRSGQQTPPPSWSAPAAA